MKNLSMLLGLIFVLSSCSSGPLEVQLPTGIPESDLEIEENTRNSHSAYFNGDLVANYASVPDIVKLTQDIGPFAKGTWLMYFNDTTKDIEDLQQVGLVYSIDNGVNWSDRLYVPVEADGEEYIVADVSIVELETGELRLYYYGLDPKGDHNKERKIFSSISSDGLSFENEALVFASMEAVNNPEVVYADGLWYLFLTVVNEKTGFSKSTNPLEFSGFTEMEDIGILGAASKGDQIFVYGCNGSVSEWEFLNDNITHIRDIKMKGCDPAPFFDETGELNLAMKEF